MVPLYPLPLVINHYVNDEGHPPNEVFGDFCPMWHVFSVMGAFQLGETPLGTADKPTHCS